MQGFCDPRPLHPAPLHGLPTLAVPGKLREVRRPTGRLVWGLHTWGACVSSAAVAALLLRVWPPDSQGRHLRRESRQDWGPLVTVVPWASIPVEAQGHMMTFKMSDSFSDLVFPFCPPGTLSQPHFAAGLSPIWGLCPRPSSTGFSCARSLRGPFPRSRALTPTPLLQVVSATLILN